MVSLVFFKRVFSGFKRIILQIFPCVIDFMSVKPPERLSFHTAAIFVQPLFTSSPTPSGKDYVSRSTDDILGFSLQLPPTRWHGLMLFLGWLLLFMFFFYGFWYGF